MNELDWAAMDGSGTEQSTGTKLFSVSGPLKRPGVYEIPMGLPLRELIFGEEYCQGMLDGTADAALEGRLLGRRRVLDLHRVEPALALEQWCLQEGLEGPRIEGGGHRDDTQLGTNLALDPTRERQREVGEQGALMDFVEDAGLSCWINPTDEQVESSIRVFAPRKNESM